MEKGDPLSDTELSDGAGTPVAGSPCTAPPATTCIDGNPATWARLSASADGGRIRVTIQNGYPLPDPAFAEDAAAYAGDVGDGPCSNLSVIFEEGELGLNFRQDLSTIDYLGHSIWRVNQVRGQAATLGIKPTDILLTINGVPVPPRLQLKQLANLLKASARKKHALASAYLW